MIDVPPGSVLKTLDLEDGDPADAEFFKTWLMPRSSKIAAALDRAMLKISEDYAGGFLIFAVKSKKPSPPGTHHVVLGAMSVGAWSLDFQAKALDQMAKQMRKFIGKETEQ